jgi:hypothetical protein
MFVRERNERRIKMKKLLMIGTLVTLLVIPGCTGRQVGEFVGGAVGMGVGLSVGGGDIWSFGGMTGAVAGDAIGEFVGGAIGDCVDTKDCAEPEVEEKEAKVNEDKELQRQELERNKGQR